MDWQVFPSQPLFSSATITFKYDIHDKLSEFFDTLMEYNRKINLVSRETSKEDLVRMAADCLVPFEIMTPRTGKIFDIGSGGGFPGIIIMLAFPGISGVLIERTEKKAAFLRMIARQFELPADILTADFIEAAGALSSNSFDFGFLKLVKPDRKILREAINLLKPGGKFVYYHDLGSDNIASPSKISCRYLNYYLDDSKQLRTITILSK